jgi:phenylpropionate dioxygenase-like ring-hydroxylating dioxygenase large terminal subunit
MSTIVDGLPAAFYTDASVFQAERELVFARNWLYAAHADEIPNAGDYVAVTIAGFPLVILRNSSEEISCFRNVCRHRGAPLLSEPCGRVETGTLTCKYHGWSYSCSGELAAVPHMDSLQDCQRQELSLIPVNISVYRGLIFVQMIPNAVPDFEKQFDDLIATINGSDCDFESYAFDSKMTREGNFNWKVWVEGYQECYHCPTIHPIFNKDFKLQRYAVENRKQFSLHSCERKTESSSGSFGGLWLWVYPNLGMPVYEPCFYTLQVNPLSVNKTQLNYTFHLRRGIDEKTMKSFREFVDQITGEDIAICEAVQRNLESGFVDKTRLNPGRENGVAYFHELVRTQLMERRHLAGTVAE